MCKHSLAVIGFQFFLPFALKNICHAKNKSGCWMPCCICIFRFLVCKSVFSLLLPSLCSCLVSDSCFRNLAEDRSGVNLKDLVHDPSLWVSPTLNHWAADPALHQAAGHWVLGHRENIKKKHNNLQRSTRFNNIYVNFQSIIFCSYDLNQLSFRSDWGT